MRLLTFALLVVTIIGNARACTTAEDCSGTEICSYGGCYDDFCAKELSGMAVPSELCRSGQTCEGSYYGMPEYGSGCVEGGSASAPNPCDPNPCQNGGTCDPNGDSYTCNCYGGFYGQNCTGQCNANWQCPVLPEAEQPRTRHGKHLVYECVNNQCEVTQGSICDWCSYMGQARNCVSGSSCQSEYEIFSHMQDPLTAGHEYCFPANGGTCPDVCRNHNDCSSDEFCGLDPQGDLTGLSTETPKCRPGCRGVNVNNGLESIPNTPIGGLQNVTCEPGYSGGGSWTCQSDGTFTGNTCTPIGMARANMMAYNKELGYVADIAHPYTGLTYYSQKVGLNQDCALDGTYVESGFLNVGGSWIQIYWVSLPRTKDCFQLLDDYNPVKNVLTNMGDNDKIYIIDSGTGYCRYTVSENHPCADKEFEFGDLTNGAGYTNGQNFKEYAPVAVPCLSGTDTGETTIAADEYAHLRMCLLSTRPALYDILESNSTVVYKPLWPHDPSELFFNGTNYEIHMREVYDGEAGRWELDSNGNFVSYSAGTQLAWATWIIRKDGANVFQTDDPFFSCNEAIHNETGRCDQDLGFTAMSTTPEGDVCWLGGKPGTDNVRYMRLGTALNPNSDWLDVQQTTVLNGCYYKVPWLSGKQFTTVHTAAGAEPNCIGNERTVDFTEVNRIDRIEHLNSPMAPGDVWKRTCPSDSSKYVNFVCTNGIATPTYTGPCASCTADAIGVCGGSCAADADSDGICDDVDDCVGAYDECNICNGPGIPQDECDCNGNVLDVIGVCGGDCTTDADNDGICDDVDPCVGTYDAIGVCNGDCTTDADNDGICDDVDPCVGALDACGVCNGPGIPQGQCDCNGNVEDECGVCNGSGIPSGQCDCNGNVLDAIGECGGSCTADADLDNICDNVDSCLLGCKELRLTGETIGNVSDPKISMAAINNPVYFNPNTPEVPPLIESMPKIVFGGNANECLTKFKTDFGDVFEEYIKESTANYDLNGAGDEVLGDKYAFGHYGGKCYFAYVNGHPNIDSNIYGGHHGGGGPSEPSTYEILSYGTGCTVLEKRYAAEGCDSTCGNTLSTTCDNLLNSHTTNQCSCN